MPIIKPLQLEPTSDIEDFAATIFQPKTFSIIYGPEGVGKTALLHKLILHRFQKGEKMRGVFLGLDNYQTYQYHQIRLADLMGVTSIKEKLTSLEFYQFTSPNTFYHLICVLPNIMKDFANYFVFADALNIAPNLTIQNEILNELKFIAKCDIPVIATMNTKPDLSDLNEYPAVKIQTFQLERPEFLGGDILEFGDTRIIKDE
jgi:GTPase SAR1 family protein